MAPSRTLTRTLCFALLSGCMLLPALSQTQANQPPANYHGPDTYGMCAYVIGDTEYYGRSFYTSSYFRPKAEQEVRAYATSQANGAPVRSHCIWSFKESDLATAKETDRRLIGMPGHPAKSVENGWAFQGGTANGSNVAGTSSAAAGSSGANTMATTQNVSARRSNTTGNYAQNTNGSYAANTAAANGSGSGTTTGMNGTSATNTSSMAGTVTGGAQQSIADAKNNMASTAAGGLTTATNSAVGALSSGMQNMFHRKQSQPQAQQGAPVAGTNSATSGQNPGTQTAAAGGAGFGFADGAATANGSQAAGPSSTAGAGFSEGLIADVSGNDVIINVGSQAGLRAGSVLTVMHAQRVVKDPATGKPLRTVESQVGELRITSVDASSASGTFSGSGVPVVGDKVRAKP